MLNKGQCPSCGKFNTINRDLRKCSACHYRLFFDGDNLALIRREMISGFYVWFSKAPGRLFGGWVHSSHLGAPNPNDSSLAPLMPDSSYGRRNLPKGCSADRVF